MRAFQAWLWSIACLAGLLFGASPAAALDVQGWDWGFDGHVVPLSFNLLIVEVVNNSPTPFDGNIVLQEGNGITRTGLPLVAREIYIEPGGRRRVQFFPFIDESWTEYSVVWGKTPDERAQIAGNSSPLRTGPRAAVLLRDSVTSRQLRAKLPTFDESDFPISVAGMDALRAVVLDHVPRWDSLRMQALRDWIGAGGQIHLLKGINGEYPTFPAPLEALNEPSDSFSLGNGRVFHHSFQTGGIGDDFVERTLGIKRGPEDPATRGYNSYEYSFQPSNSIAPLLRDLTRPDHNWALIYLLSFVYLLVVFPGCWLLGRRRADFRISYPALLGAVFIFSMAFKTVGQRGYGEETAWNAVGTAKRVAPGRFLTEAWSNAFVTAGGIYDYKHKGEGQIYSSGGSNDTRSGECFNRPAAGIEIEIPPFSSQTIMHTAVVAAPDFELKLQKAEGRGPGLTLDLELTGQTPTIYSMHCVYQNQRYMLNRAGNILQATAPQPLSTYVMNQPNYVNPYNRSTTNDAATIYTNAEQPLVARSLRMISESRNGEDLRLPDGMVRVFLYADMPTEFLEVEGGPARRQGRMLYVFDFPVDRM